MRLRWALLMMVALVAFSSAAQDVVRVKYLPAYPLPDESMEGVDIEVKRLFSSQRGRELDVDRYFAAIARILLDEKVTSNWERSVVHAPYVRVEIALGGKNLILGASYSVNGLDSFPGPDDSNERHRRALEAILKLTLQRLQAKTPVK